MDRQEIYRILGSAGLRPQHQFGQNFMVDQNILTAIADAGAIEPHDVVLEVGPGVGNLTRLLSQRARAVLAVDIDRKLMPAAQRYHAELKNITWLNADVLAGKHEINPDVVAALTALIGEDNAGGLRLVSNLPYNAASPLVAELLVLLWRTHHTPGAAPLPLKRLAFTVQWEVALRMQAAVNTSDYGPLGILIQLMADVEIVRKIPPGAFWPPPKIHSGLVAVTPDVEKIKVIPDALAVQSLLSGLFSHRRQTLLNGLKHYLDKKLSPELTGRITAAGIDLTLRPEAITPQQFLLLSSLLAD